MYVSSFTSFQDPRSKILSETLPHKGFRVPLPTEFPNLALAKPGIRCLLHIHNVPQSSAVQEKEGTAGAEKRAAALCLRCRRAFASRTSSAHFQVAATSATWRSTQRLRQKLRPHLAGFGSFKLSGMVDPRRAPRQSTAKALLRSAAGRWRYRWRLRWRYRYRYFWRSQR